MELIFNREVFLHEIGGHPESVNRIKSLGNIKETPFFPDEAILYPTHTPTYVERVKTQSELCQPLDADTPLSKGSFLAALCGSQLAITASENQGFAVGRPPGHHAFTDRGSGFCIFNHMAIAAQKWVEKGKRVMIFDFDGHCGDGTSSIFYDSDQVLVVSIHQWPAFPGTGNIDEVGKGKGLGHTINVPLPASSGDDIFWDALKALEPVMKTFNPDIVGLSAGFDGHILDPLLQLRYSLSLFYKIGHYFKSNFPHVFAVLEGGYEIDILPKAIHNFRDGWEGRPMTLHEKPTDSTMMAWSEYEYKLDQLLSILKTHWGI